MPRKRQKNPVGRPRKEPWTMVCFKLRDKILTKVNQAAKRDGKTKTSILEKALEEYLGI